MGKLLGVQDFLDFRILQVYHGLSTLLWHIQRLHPLQYPLSLRCNIFIEPLKTRRPANHRITESHGDQADHALPGLERAVLFSETPEHPKPSAHT